MLYGMDHTLWSVVLSQSATTPVADRCRSVVDLVIRTTQATSVTVCEVSPHDSTHHALLNVGYPDDVLEYILAPRFTEGCPGFRSVRNNPDVIYSWDDLPNFRDTYTAFGVFQPSGFNNGASVMLRDNTGRTIGVVHASVRDSDFQPDTKETLASIRPLLTEWTALISRFADAHLSAREHEVLSLVRDGLSNAEIAKALTLAPRTVSTHVERVLHKLRTTNRTEAAVLAERAGLPRSAHVRRQPAGYALGLPAGQPRDDLALTSASR
ncbi:MAG: LuxR family transcriptional regulator [Hyphomicrobiales bacterium]|nr:MAG: LuxR family transcriptional regulator [Hyphomicrobiales bacterium]